jgi:hypothetical protein
VRRIDDCDATAASKHDNAGKGEFVDDSPTREEAARKFDAISKDYEARYPAREHYRGGPGAYDVGYPALEPPRAPETGRGPPMPRAAREEVPLEQRGGRNYPDLRLRTEFRSSEPHTTQRDLSIQTILADKNYTKKIADAVRPFLPKELKVVNGRRVPDAQLIENAIEFFKRNKRAHYEMLLRQPWAQRTLKQYEGYNIRGHQLVDEYGHTIQEVLGTESAVSQQTPPDMSFSIAERLMRVIRDAGDTRWDARFDRTVKDKNVDGITPENLAQLQGKDLRRAQQSEAVERSGAKRQGGCRAQGKVGARLRSNFSFTSLSSHHSGRDPGRFRA